MFSLLVFSLLINYGSSTDCVNTEKQILTEIPEDNSVFCSSVDGWDSDKDIYLISSGIVGNIPCQKINSATKCNVQNFGNNDILRIKLVLESSGMCVKECIYEFKLFEEDTTIIQNSSSTMFLSSPSMDHYITPTLTHSSTSADNTCCTTSSTSMITATTNTLYVVSASPELNVTMSDNGGGNNSVALISAVIATVSVIGLAIICGGIFLWVGTILHRIRKKRDIAHDEELQGQGSGFIIMDDAQGVIQVEQEHRTPSLTTSTEVNPSIKRLTKGGNSGQTSKTSILRRESETSGASSQETESTMLHHDKTSTSKLLSGFEEECYNHRNPEIKRKNPLFI